MCLLLGIVEFNWEIKGLLIDFKVYNVDLWIFK